MVIMFRSYCCSRHNSASECILSPTLSKACSYYSPPWACYYVCLSYWSDEPKLALSFTFTSPPNTFLRIGHYMKRKAHSISGSTENVYLCNQFVVFLAQIQTMRFNQPNSFKSLLCVYHGCAGPLQQTSIWKCWIISTQNVFMLDDVGLVWCVVILLKYMGLLYALEWL